MSFHFPSRIFRLAALLAALPLLGAVPAPAATTPGVTCAAAAAKAVSKCTKKAVSVHAACYKKTGADCASSDVKLAAAFDSAAKLVKSKCDNASAVADAGYAPYQVGTFGIFAGDSCKWQARLISERSFGRNGSRYTSADKDGQKCLQTAAKAASKYLAGALGDLGKCLTTAGCTPDFSPDGADTVTLLNMKCANFATVAGTDAATFIAAATAQIPSAVASPCDPMDTTRCAFPFPNDYFSVPGASTPSTRRLAFGGNTLPANQLRKVVAPGQWNEADGFSIGPMLLFNDVNVDLAVTGATPITDLARSLDADAPVVLIDAATGEHQLLWLERDLRGATAADQPIIGRVGRNLKEGHRYIVAMRHMKDASGATLNPGPGFAVYRDNTPTAILPVEARRAHMEEIFTTLASYGIARSELYLAWDFTTQSSESTAGRLLAMRDDAFDILGTAAPSFTVDSVVEPVDANIFRQIDGTFQVPLYLNTGGIPGSSLRTDANGVPVNNGDFFTAQYRCVVPYAATTGGVAPAVPARVSVYGHGLLGSHIEISAGNVLAFSSEHNIIQCATDWTGFAEDDADFVVMQVLPDFSKFPNFIDRQHQGILNALMLGRLLIHPDGFTSNAAFQVGGEPMIDASALFYDGNSQGGILGGVLAAFSQDATRFSLGVPGMNYSTLLDRSVDFIAFDSLLAGNYPNSTDRNLLLSLAQILWDRTDPNGHINHVLSDPYENTPAKTLLYQVAFGDHQVAPVTVEVAARSNGMSIHQPALSPGKVVPEVTPYYAIPAIPSYPFDGSAMVIWDAGNPAPPTGNIPPPEITPSDPEWADLGPCAQGHDSDPHSCPRSNPDARTQKSEFLKIGGMVVDVCGGAACLAP